MVTLFDGSRNPSKVIKIGIADERQGVVFVDAYAVLGPGEDVFDLGVVHRRILAEKAEFSNVDMHAVKK